MENGEQRGTVGELVDAEDRRYAETMAPGVERDAMIASLARYRKPDELRTGVSVPALTVRSADDLEPISLPRLSRGRPLLLVFGSFT